MNSTEVSIISNERSLIESVKKWRDRIGVSSKSDGFKLLVERYGFEDVLCLLAKTDWNPGVRIGELMTHIDYFYHKKREGKKRKTIAAYYKRIAANGGTERVVAMLCNRWAEMKDDNGEYLYNVVLVTEVEPVAGEYELSEKVQRAYIPSRIVSVKDNFRARYQAWAKIIKDFDIDIVIDSLESDPISYWDMLAIKGQPSKPAFIVHLHLFCLEMFRAVDAEISKMYKYMCCDGAVTLSQCDKLFVSAFNHHVECIVNPIAFNPRTTPLSTYNEKTIVWVGRIAQEKQPVDVIRMMKFVVEKISDARLIIVGDGDENLKIQMRELIQTYGLGKNIEMVGFAFDVGRYYGSASVFICTSLYEGFSLTMGEAMAFGIPVLTYDMPWLSFIQNGRGIIAVPQKDCELLAKKVIELLNNKDQMKRIGLRGRQHITEVAECNIEKECKTFFDTISGQKSDMYSKQDPVSILFKYLTLFQHMGKQKVRNDLTNQYIQNFITARLDIKNFGTAGNTVEIIKISDKTAKIQFPGWFKNAQGQGIVLQSSLGDIRLIIKCCGTGTLEIALRGVDCRDKNNNRVPIWIDFKKLNVNGEDIFTGSHIVCHDRPFKHRFDVADGEIVTLNVAWWRAVD